MFCTECGAKNEETAKFCFQCGAPMSGGPTNPVEEPKAPPAVVTVPEPIVDRLDQTMPGKKVSVRQYIQDERMNLTKKNEVIGFVKHVLKVSDEVATNLVEDAWNSIPPGKLTGARAKNTVGIAIGLFLCGGFFLIIGCVILGAIRNGISDLGIGKPISAVLAFAVAVGLFYYARSALR